jgi:hypothetical protein
MITKEELFKVGYHTNDGTEFYDGNGPQSMYNIKEQTLYSHCEVDGVGEKLCMVKDINKLVELYYEIFKEEI